MTSKLKCPFCGEELYDNRAVSAVASRIDIYLCVNSKCGESDKLIGTKELWQALIQAKQDLEQSEKCCSAWETQALDYKAETIALSGKLEIATKALEEIDTTRCVPQQTLISLGKLSKTTRFNAGNIICVATPDYIHNTLEQIEHIADTSKMIEHKE